MKHTPLLTVWDIDQTLIDSADVSEMYRRTRHYFLRPGAREAIETSLRLGPNMVWSAGGEEHVARAIAFIRAQTGLDWPLQRIWSAERCPLRVDHERQTMGLHKPLRKVFRFWPKERVIAVDDLAENFVTAYSNHVPIPAWHGDPEDRALFALADYLPTLSAQGNVRTVEKRRWLSAAGQAQAASS